MRRRAQPRPAAQTPAPSGCQTHSHGQRAEAISVQNQSHELNEHVNVSERKHLKDRLDLVATTTSRYTAFGATFPATI